MKERTNKIKNWWKEHKEEIKIKVLCAGTGALLTGMGYFVGSKLMEFRIGLGLQRIHDKGIIKLFDPRSGVEIGVEEFEKVTREVFDI